MTHTLPHSLDAMKRELLMRQLQRAAPKADGGTALAPRARGAVVPLSWAQQRLWFLCQFDPGASLAYHMPCGLRLSGRLDRAALQAALDHILARHEVLRTRIGGTPEHPQQVIDAADGIGLAFDDLRNHAPAARDAALQGLCAAQVAAPFDLTRDRPVRAGLVALADDEHVLLVVIHHIACDGWSVNVLVSELGALYAAFAADAPDPLPPLALQYADYAVWQREGLQGAALARQIGFWKDTLAGAPALLELPTDRPRRAAQGHAGASVPVHLDASLTAGVRTLAHRHGATPFMVLAAAWGLLLGRLARQDDVVIGTPVANRTQRATEPLIGFFVNTLALRVSLAGLPTVAALLARVRSGTLTAFAHQDLPFEQVVEAVNPARSMSHSPVFQTMLSLETAGPGSAMALPGLALAAIELPHGTTHYDLMLGLTDAGEHIVGILEYATDLFDPLTMTGLVGRLRGVLAAMVADDTQPVHHLPLMDAAEAAQLRDGFNATDQPFPHDRTVVEVFAEQVALAPHAPAIIDGATTWTYAQLDAHADAVARRLRALGVQPDQLVAVLAERGAALVAAMLGILKAGAAYVPMDPGYPEARLAAMLADCAPVAVLAPAAHSQLAAALGPADVPLIVLEQALQDEPGSTHAAATGVPLTARHLAYVIYTSGSTGAPKGVMVEHRSVLRLALSEGPAAIRPGDRVAFCSNPAFDATTWEIWATLLRGACVVAVPNALLLDAIALRHELEARAVNIMFLTVGLFNQHAELLGPFFGGMDSLLFGGEQSDPAVVDRVRRHHPPRRLVNCYGPTETTTFATTYVVPSVDPAAPVDPTAPLPSLPIGRPIANTTVHVLDGHGRAVPVGAIGEIHVGGPGVARGYLNQPELTAERFVPDPFAGGDARLYRTGDLGRWRADGTLDCLGRTDRQVKLRGYRIEPAEIESCIGRCAGVRESVVMMREDTPGERRLVAYVVADAGTGMPRSAQDLARDLRAALQRSLPEVMVPASFVVLPVLPLTPNGKVDRRALPAPEAPLRSARAHEAPQAGLESALATLWCELLRVDQVGRQDHFFELGGHSLLAAQLVARLRTLLGRDVALRDVFGAPTLAALAEVVAHAVEQADAPVRADRSGPLPLSFAQSRLWFLDRLDPQASLGYHMPAALRLSGSLDVTALQAALDGLVMRHEVLRTCFPEIDGAPVQHIAAALPLPLAVIDLRSTFSHDAATGEQALRREVAEHAARPFDLAHGPVVRATLWRLTDAEHVLLVTQHHIVSDAWSIGLLVRELGALYASAVTGAPDPLGAPPALQYADHAAWQRQWLRGARLQEQLAFWRGELTGAPVLLALPTDHPRPAQASHRGSAVPVQIDTATTAALRGLAQAHGTTLFTTLLCAWGLLLARLSGQDDVVIGVPVANRARPEVQSLAGFFVNTLAMRLTVPGEASVATLLDDVATRSARALGHADLPFDQVVEAVHPVRSLSHAPLFQAMLNLHSTPADASLTLPGLTLCGLEQPLTTTHFDLTLALSESPQAVAGVLEYATDLFEPATAQRLAAQFQAVLRAMAADPAQPVNRLDLVDAAQRAWLLGPVARDAAADARRDPACAGDTLDALFERQVRTTPEAVALIDESRTLSFDALNRRANQLARRLVALGASPESRIALCVERTVDKLVAVLAIWKAGAAYVPLDPAHPPQRLADMLADSAPVALLAHRALLETLPPSTLPLVVLDDARTVSQLAAERDDDLRASTDPRRLAYVIYTSGSTGRPKGVMVEHASVVNLWQALGTSALAGVPRPARVALNARLAFDASVKMVVQLLSGHTLVLVPQRLRADGGALVRFLSEQSIDVFDTTPAQLDLLLDAGLAALCRGQARTVLIGGEAIPPAMWRRLRRLRGLDAWNVYGPTECTVDASLTRIRDAGETPDIGRPLAGARLYVLDAGGQPVPPGVPGEIHIGGAGVARGYLGQPALTAQRFVTDPFAGRPDAAMYRTGDLACWSGDGRLRYIGRNDFQVKLRGYRLELGDVEAALARCPGVREAVASVREDAPGERRLVAHLRLESTAPALDTATLRTHLRATLPDYMVPTAFVPVDRFPLSVNGKIDRRALPAPASDTGVAGYIAPEGALETALAAAWAALLAQPRVGRDDDFFALGGHSLLAVQLVARLRAEHGVDVPLRELFMHPVLADFAVAVARCGRDTGAPIAPVSRTAAIPLSWSQQRLWILDRLVPETRAAFHMAYGLRLDGMLDPLALRAALDRIVARHESLRTRFPRDVAQQHIDPADAGFPLAVQDLRGLAEPAQHAAVQAQGRETAQAPFDLAEGRLLRGRLLQLSDTAHVLLLAWHHIVSDGVSVGVLMRELGALYAAFRAGQPDPLPPLAIQYPDYAAWQRTDTPAAGSGNASLAWWLEHLSGAPACLALPTDRPRPVQPSHAGASVPLGVPPAVAARLAALGRRHGTTLFMHTLAAWSALLSRLGAQGEVVVGTPVANRPRAELEPLIGFFANTLALRVDLRDDPCLADLLAQVRETSLAAFSHAGTPFDRVVEAVRPVRDTRHAPLFQTLLVVEAARPPGEATLPGLTVTPLATQSTSAQYELTLVLGETGNGLVGTLEYATDLFDTTTAHRLARYFEAVLTALAQDELTLVSELPLMTAAERAHLLALGTGAQVGGPGQPPLHRAFEARARHSPEAPALRRAGSDRVVSYAALDARANALAHRLRGRGVGAESRVALCLPRGESYVTALLAVWKAGGAAVPLDPQWPAQRLAWMCEDCTPAVLITERETASVLGTAGARVAHIEWLNAQGISQENAETHAVRPAADTTANTGVQAGADAAAYVVYTSGSTGRPKGVVVTQTHLAALTHSLIEAYEVGPGSRVLQFVSIGFDVGLSEVTMALASGATLCVADAADLAPGMPLARTVAALGVTHLSLPVAALAAFEPEPATALASVRTLVVGGDVLPPALARRWCAGRVLFNAYGPTEATVCAVQHRVVDVPADAPRVPLGRPLPHVRAYVVDAQGALAPAGVVGELCLGGDAIARGYHARDDAEAMRFGVDPFTGRPGGRMYRTGDRVAWQPDGTLDFHGRNDAQVKVRGHRIEPGEIEAALRALPGVRDAVVMARADRAGASADLGATRLVAWVSTSVPAQVSAAALQDALRATLPAPMLPSDFVVLAELPLTPSGKVDRAALPEPQARAVGGAPETVLERTLATIWCELLGLPRVGREDHFFELGGHSLLAVRLAGRLSDAQGLDLALHELFRHPTLAALAQRLDTLVTDVPTRASTGPLVALRAAGSQAPLFLVHPGEGEVGYARELLAHLPADLPVHALAAPGLQAGETPANRVEDLARAYVGALRRVQPHGPYRVAGWSVGGTIAWEMAQQLVGADETVSFLGLIDTVPRYPTPPREAERVFDPVQALQEEMNQKLPQWPHPVTSRHCSCAARRQVCCPPNWMRPRCAATWRCARACGTPP